MRGLNKFHNKYMKKNKNNSNVLKLLIELWIILSSKRKLQLRILFLLMLLSSLAELVSLSSVFPFLKVIASPDDFFAEPYIQDISSFLGINNSNELILFFTIAFVFTSLLSGLIRLATLYFNGKLAASIGSDLSSEAYNRALAQPYSYHIGVNSSQLISTINLEIQLVTDGVLNPILILVSSSLILLSLLATLVIINWRIACGSISVISFIYLLAVRIGRLPLQALGAKQVLLNGQILKLLQESFGAIKDILIGGTQNYYLKKYNQIDRPLRETLAKLTFLNSYPRMILEPVGITIIAFIAYMLMSEGRIETALPTLGALALGSQRILPTSQKIYEGWSQSNRCKKSLFNILSLIRKPIEYNPLFYDSQKVSKNQLENNYKITFKNVSFKYSNVSSEVLSNINFTINSGERIGIIGKTGSGKSTFVDLLVGLLIPTNGKILLDANDINDLRSQTEVSRWRAGIAYVPQNIYLADCSIAENIAFGISKEQINLSKVRYAAGIAQAREFIESTKNEYFTNVGEAGVRLSGGQRQRIGIARALYKSPKMVILDEATSALDKETESLMIESLNNMSNRLTIVQISHRPSTLYGSDRIIRIENTKIKVVSHEKI